MSNKMALDALNDLLNGWRYIRSTHGELYGVGWDRADAKAVAAIAALQAEPQGWMPISEAPKDGTRYLAYDGKYIREENSPAHHAAGDWTLIDGEWRGRAFGVPALLWIPLSALPATPPKD